MNKYLLVQVSESEMEVDIPDFEACANEDEIVVWSFNRKDTTLVSAVSEEAAIEKWRKCGGSSAHGVVVLPFENYVRFVNKGYERVE